MVKKAGVLYSQEFHYRTEEVGRVNQRWVETGRVRQSNKIISFVRERLLESSRAGYIICSAMIRRPQSSCPEEEEEEQQQQQEVFLAFYEPAFRNFVAAQVKNKLPLHR